MAGTDLPRAAAAAFVREVCERHTFGADALDDVFGAADLDGRDKAFAEAVGKGTLSHLVNIDAVIRSVSAIPPDRIDPPVRAILRTAVWQIFYSGQIPDHAACDESVTLAARFANEGAAGFANAVLRAVIRDKAALNEKYISHPSDFSLRCSMPPELAGYFKKWFGKERAAAIAAALHEAPPLTVRANRLKTDAFRLKDSLEAEGFGVTPARFMDDAFLIRTDGRGIASSASFCRGEFAVQDEAAMLVSVIADPKPGGIAADVCAAPGGKSCHMADRMENRGRIHALDISESRLELVRENAARLGADIVACRQADAREATPDDLGGETAGTVLADVPCSGLGILRRKPDIMLNMTHERILALYPLQEAILDRAASLVTTGGTLVYSTCTLNPAENVERVRGFLDGHRNSFEMSGFGHLLPARLAAADPDLVQQAEGGMITLYPDTHGCDGFFIARMRRIS